MCVTESIYPTRHLAKFFFIKTYQTTPRLSRYTSYIYHTYPVTLMTRRPGYTRGAWRSLQGRYHECKGRHKQHSHMQIIKSTIQKHIPYNYSTTNSNFNNLNECFQHVTYRILCNNSTYICIGFNTERNLLRISRTFRMFKIVGITKICINIIFAKFF